MQKFRYRHISDSTKNIVIGKRINGDRCILVCPFDIKTYEINSYIKKVSAYNEVQDKADIFEVRHKLVVILVPDMGYEEIGYIEFRGKLITRACLTTKGTTIGFYIRFYTR